MSNQNSPARGGRRTSMRRELKGEQPEPSLKPFRRAKKRKKKDSTETTGKRREKKNTVLPDGRTV